MLSHLSHTILLLQLAPGFLFSNLLVTPNLLPLSYVQLLFEFHYGVCFSRSFYSKAFYNFIKLFCEVSDQLVLTLKQFDTFVRFTFMWALYLEILPEFLFTYTSYFG